MGLEVRLHFFSEEDTNFESVARMKKSTGIPRSFVLEVPDTKVAMLTNTGNYAIPTMKA